MERLGNMHTVAMKAGRRGNGSMPWRAVAANGRGRVLPPAPRSHAGPIPARDASDYRGVVFIIIVSALAFGWLLLIRNVRAGLPGDYSSPTRSAGTAERAGGVMPEPSSGARPDFGAYRRD